MSITIAFNTANLVAQYSGWRFELKNWNQQHQQVVERTSATEWQSICRGIADAGYTAVEVWLAHVERCADDDARAAEFRNILREHNLTPVALAGHFNDTTARICQKLAIPQADGGYVWSDKQTVRRLMRQTGILFNYENHPENSVDDIRAAVDLGAHGVAVALDTGWLGTQGVDAVDAVRQLGRLIRHVHLKDVAAPGAHHTVKLGAGCVNIPAVLAELRAIGYSGVLSWEDEPEDRNPFDIAAEMREYIQAHWPG